MRRWVCIVALLAGFTGDTYPLFARVRIPAPIERPIELRPLGSGLRPRPAWWLRS